MQPCKEFQNTIETIANNAFNLFLGILIWDILGINGEIYDWNEDNTECNISIDNNPFALFTDMPNEYNNLKYSNLLCGIIRGSLEMVNVFIFLIYRF